MRDVIVIGAGGGGPVVAAELAGRGLDVLVLDGGPRHADPEQEWSRAENDANNPNDGFFRFGPEDHLDERQTGHHAVCPGREPGRGAGVRRNRCQ